jgi:hypothetical protein
MLIFGSISMKAYHDYIDRLDSGKMKAHKAHSMKDVIEGTD